MPHISAHRVLPLVIVAIFGALLFFAPAMAISPTQEMPPATGRVIQDANLRTEPSATAARAGGARAGDIIEITACNATCDWYQLKSGVWIAAFLVESIDGVATSATSTPAASKTAAPASTTPVATNAVTGTIATAASAGNLRAGPGTTFARVGSVSSGQSLEIVAQNSAGDWLQLADGNWIAAFLVRNAPANLPTSNSASAMATTSTTQTGTTAALVPEDQGEVAAAPAPTATSTDIKTQWQEGNDIGKTFVCGHYEYKVTDVRRKKSLWFYDDENLAQGEWLLLFIEAKNISPGTSYFGDFSPRLITIGDDGAFTLLSGDGSASYDASWMYQHGRIYETTNPGGVLGMVEAYDLPLSPDLLIGFAMGECPDDILALGVWSQIPQPDPK